MKTMNDSSPRKQSRKSITLALKLEIIRKMENGSSNTQISRDYGIGRSTISTIWSQREKFLGAQANLNSSVKKMRPLAPEKRNLDDSLLKWIRFERDQSVPLTYGEMREKANQLMTCLATAEPTDSNSSSEQFRCTQSWIERFKKRHNIQIGYTQEVSHWLTSEWPAIRKRYSDENIFSGCSIGLFYRLTPDDIDNYRDTTCKQGEYANERLTIWLCANMDGSEKAKLLIVGKSKTPECIKNHPAFPISYEMDKNAFVTSEILTRHLETWNKVLEEKERRILLVVDNCTGHLKLKKFDGIEVIQIAPNTAALQPMKQGVIKSLKTHYRRQLLFKLIESHENNTKFAITTIDAVFMLNAAWRNIRWQTISNSFRHAGFCVVTGLQEEKEENGGISFEQWMFTENDMEPDDQNLLQWARSKDIDEFNDTMLSSFDRIDEHVAACEDTECRALETQQDKIFKIELCDDDDDGVKEDTLPTEQEAFTAIETVSRFVQLAYADSEQILTAVDNLEKMLRENMLRNRVLKKLAAICKPPK